MVVLSNTSSRAYVAAKKFIKMEFPDFNIPFVTSGELAWYYLDERFRGKKCTWITWRRHESDKYLNSLNISLASIEEADFLFFHGTQTIASNDDPAAASDVQLSLFYNGQIDFSMMEVLKIAQSRKIPAICANMDFSAMLANGKLAYMPGILKREYEMMGGEVVCFGKPQKDFFEEAIGLGTKAFLKDNNDNEMNLSSSLAKKKRVRVIHVGDSLHHDIAGAAAAGIDSLLITQHGVHREDLLEEETNQSISAMPSFITHCNDAVEAAVEVPPLLMRVTDICDRLQVARPYFILRSFAV
mmetsp:Transcript_29325/g.40304  ORF Transcript_29325/g.40304 Transcript_29325/m.40304 type:complete len:299 (+) Transcript_29325:219-1115(+)